MSRKKSNKAVWGLYGLYLALALVFIFAFQQSFIGSAEFTHETNSTVRGNSVVIRSTLDFGTTTTPSGSDGSNTRINTFDTTTNTLTISSAYVPGNGPYVDNSNLPVFQTYELMNTPIIDTANLQELDIPYARTGNVVHRSGVAGSMSGIYLVTGSDTVIELFSAYPLNNGDPCCPQGSQSGTLKVIRQGNEFILMKNASSSIPIELPNGTYRIALYATTSASASACAAGDGCSQQESISLGIINVQSNTTTNSSSSTGNGTVGTSPPVNPSQPLAQEGASFQFFNGGRLLRGTITFLIAALVGAIVCVGIIKFRRR